MSALCPKRTNALQQMTTYSTTSSARPTRQPSGIIRPSRRTTLRRPVSFSVKPGVEGSLRRLAKVNRQSVVARKQVAEFKPESALGRLALLALALPLDSCHISGMPDRSSKRPRDPNQLAKFMVDAATDLVEECEALGTKNAAAVALGRRGGLKGGRARAEKLSAARRKAIAQKAASARWKTNDR
jgi:hypothetical protein